MMIHDDRLNNLYSFDVTLASVRQTVVVVPGVIFYEKMKQHSATVSLTEAFALSASMVIWC